MFRLKGIVIFFGIIGGLFLAAIALLFILSRTWKPTSDEVIRKACLTKIPIAEIIDRFPGDSVDYKELLKTIDSLMPASVVIKHEIFDKRCARYEEVVSEKKEKTLQIR